MKCGLIAEALIEKELQIVVNGITGGVQQENSSNSKLSPAMQIRLAEAGRIALK
jgi:hypothetical protein